MIIQPHISIQNLNVHIGENHILKNINLDIPDKKVTSLIGPSGCGKTTLLKTMNRLLDRQNDVRVDGKVLVDGENIYDPKAEVTHIRKKMGLLSQRPFPLPMNIYDNIAYGQRIHGNNNRKQLDEIVEKYLRDVNLWDEVKDRLKSPATRLSIGQQQRLCLARGLAIEPEIRTDIGTGSYFNSGNRGIIYAIKRQIHDCSGHSHSAPSPKSFGLYWFCLYGRDHRIWTY
jgi:phosphate transport system ATP-binding protein